MKLKRYIGAGIMVAELQQNSDTTYRLYDYGRLDADGKPRQLHLDQAIRTADLSPLHCFPTAMREDGAWGLLCKMPSFSLYGGCCPRSFPDSDDFCAVMALEDLEFECSGDEFLLERGRTAYVPPHTELKLLNHGGCLFMTPKGNDHV